MCRYDSQPRIKKDPPQAGTGLYFLKSAWVKYPLFRSEANQPKTMNKNFVSAVLCAFDAVDGAQLSAHEQALLFSGFLRIWNRQRRPECFPATETQLRGLTGLSEGSFKRARKSLVDKGVVKWYPGIRNWQPAEYSLGSRFNVALEPTLEPTLEPAPYIKEKEKGKKSPLTPQGGKRSRTPSADDLIAAIPSDFPASHRQAAEDWAIDKQSRGQSRMRFQSLNAWEKSLNRMLRYKADVVVDAVEQAIASGWQGWEQEKTKENLVLTDPTKTSEPTWLPNNWREIAAEVTGKTAGSINSVNDVPRGQQRLEFERACRLGEAV